MRCHQAWINLRFGVTCFFLSAAGWAWPSMEGSGGAWGAALTSAPTIQLQPDAPLAGLLQFSTDVPATAEFLVKGGTDQWVIQSTVARTDHSIPLLGLAPDTTYTIDSIGLDGGGGDIASVNVGLMTTTARLPGGFVGYEIQQSQPNKMEPGFTLFTSFGRTQLIDSAGVVRWYLNDIVAGPYQQPSGRLLGRNGAEIREYDWLGNVTAAWHVPGYEEPSPGSIEIPEAVEFHHDQIRLPNGNILALDRDAFLVDNFPTSNTNPNAPRETMSVRQDIVHEFTPEGVVVSSWNLADIIDPVRIGYGVARTPPIPQDWSHANSVAYDSSDDSIIVSSRHQDAVVKFDRGSGDLKWILAPHDNWGPEYQPYLLTPIGGDEFEWSYHIHAPKIVPDDPSNPTGPDVPGELTLIIHDNGNFRASPYDPPLPDAENYTRAVEYKIDEANMTIEQTWSYGKEADEVYYSGSRGDVDWLSETGNVLIDFTDTSYINGEAQEGLRSRIVEVNREGEVVFAMRLFNPNNDAGNAVTYRADRIKSLYLGTEFTQTIVPDSTPPGDYNGDGIVEGGDFLVWQRGESPNPLSIADLADWQSNYGTTAPLAKVSATAPEPTSALLSIIGAFTLIGCAHLSRPKVER